MTRSKISLKSPVQRATAKADTAALTVAKLENKERELTEQLENRLNAAAEVARSREQALTAAREAYVGRTREAAQATARVAPAMEAATAAVGVFEAAGHGLTRGLDMMTSAASGIMGVFGGPWGAAVTAAMIGIEYLATVQTDATNGAEKYANEIKAVETRLRMMAQASQTAAQATSAISCLLRMR